MMKKIIATGLICLILISTIFWQANLYERSNNIVEFLLQAGEACKSGNKSICGVLPATENNLRFNLSLMISPLANKVGDNGKYEAAILLMRETAEMSANDLRASEDRKLEIERMAASFENIKNKSAESRKSDAENFSKFTAEYDMLAKPKIMYSCGGQISYTAGNTFNHYNDLYMKAKSNCPDGWEFKVLKSEK